MADYRFNASLNIVPNSFEFKNVTPVYLVNYMAGMNISTMYILFENADGTKITIDTFANAFVAGDANSDPSLYATLLSATESYIGTMEI